jgi:transposase
LVHRWNHGSAEQLQRFYPNQLQSRLQGDKMNGMVTATEAAKKIGCSTATVSRWAKFYGYQLRYGNSLLLTEKQVKTIESTWKQGTGNPNFRKKSN